MAKKATSAPKPVQPKAAAAPAPAVSPTPALLPEQGVIKTVSTSPGLPSPEAGAPPEVLGVFSSGGTSLLSPNPQQAGASAAAASADGGAQPSSEVATPGTVQPRPYDEEELDDELLQSVADEAPAPSARPLDPEILAEAAKFQTGHGKPLTPARMPRFALPAPPDLRRPRKP